MFDRLSHIRRLYQRSTFSFGIIPEVCLASHDHDVGKMCGEFAMALLQSVRYNEPITLNAKTTATFHNAGHIMGSAISELAVRKMA